MGLKSGFILEIGSFSRAGGVGRDRGVPILEKAHDLRMSSAKAEMPSFEPRWALPKHL